MKQDNSKQRLVEVMTRLDKTFKPQLNEELGFEGQGEKFRAEVTGKGENVWSTNAMEYDTEEEAKEWLRGLSNRWFGYDMGRVVPVSTPTNQPLDMENDIIFQNFREGVNEVFGWSQKEKEIKVNSGKIEQAKQEIQKYPPSHIFGQPGRNSAPQDEKNLMNVRINMAKQYMPTLAELMPQLFDLTQGYGDMVQIYNGKPIRGLVPSNWYYFLRGQEGYLDNNQAVQKLNQEIDGLGQKMGLQEEDKWIQKAVDPAHKGYCTPMTKDTCTPRRKALAKRFKAGIEDKSIMEAIVGDNPEEYRTKAERLKQTIDNLFNEEHFDIIDTLYRLIVERRKPTAPELSEMNDASLQ